MERPKIQEAGRPAAVDRRRDLLELGGGATPPAQHRRRRNATRAAPSPLPPPSLLFALDFALDIGTNFSLDFFSLSGDALVGEGFSLVGGVCRGWGWGWGWGAEVG